MGVGILTLLPKSGVGLGVRFHIPRSYCRPPLTLLLFSWQAPREALAQTVLAEVPMQLVSYFKAQGWAPFKPLPLPAKGPAQAPQA